ncbi:MAG: LysR family transcriptional regulator [Bdellovibrionota bacterium]
METYKLEAFVTFSQTESVRKAAELLGISPGALSKILHSLEHDLGIPLIIPVGRQVTLTAEARAFLPDAKRMIEEWKSIKKALIGIKDEKKLAPLRLATFEVFSTYFLTGLDQIDLKCGMKLYEAVPGEIERLVLDHKVDMGITYLPVPHPRLDFLKIRSVEMGVYVKKGSFKDIDQQEIPFVVPIAPLSGSPTKAKGLDGWPETAYERQVLYEVTLLESGLELCRQGRCAGYFPVFIADEHNRRVKPQFELERKSSPYGGAKCYANVYLVKLKSNPEDALMKKMAKMIRTVCG